MGGARLEDVDLLVDGEAHLRGVSLSVPAGGVTTLLGPTRAGKTSVLRILAGLDRPTRGAVAVGGSVSMVYQEFVNYPSLTVHDNIASPLRVARVPRAVADRRVREVAARLGLETLLDRRPAELSGGQQQRVALGRALAKDADVVLLDEPLASLDFKLREELRAELRALFADGRRTVVYATSDAAEALSFGGDVVLLDEGRVRAAGPAREVYDRPADRDVARLFGDPPIQLLPVTVHEGPARPALTLPTGVRVPWAGDAARVPAHAATLGVRPHHLSLARRGAGSVRLEVEVLAVELLGSTTRVRLRHGPLPLELIAPGVRADEARTAREVWLDPRRALLFGEDGRRIDPPEAARGPA